MIRFENDDRSYLAWLESNPTGFVINCDRNPKSSFLMLHNATCKYISTPKRSNWTTNDYIKICSNSRTELVKWSKSKTGGQAELCKCMKRRGQVTAEKLQAFQMKLDGIDVQTSRIDAVIAAYSNYEDARRNLLLQLGLSRLDHDPLADISEWLIATFKESSGEESQESFDVVGPNRELVHIKVIDNETVEITTGLACDE